MARHHFDDKGFPLLQEIVGEIVGFVGSLRIKPSETPGFFVIENQIDSLVMKEWMGTPTQFGTPFKVEGIYVVGGQALHLPDSYNKGEHDFDLKVQTNVREITGTSIYEILIMGALASKMNNGQMFRYDRKEKEFVIDLVPMMDQLYPPYVQIYPVMKKVAGL